MFSRPEPQVQKSELALSVTVTEMELDAWQTQSTLRYHASRKVIYRYELAVPVAVSARQSMGMDVIVNAISTMGHKVIDAIYHGLKGGRSSWGRCSGWILAESRGVFFEL